MNMSNITPNDTSNVTSTDTSNTALQVWSNIRSVLLAIIMLSTLVLNSLLIFVLRKMKSRRSKRDCSSHNIEKSYMYLLLHLAFADMLGVVLNIPFGILDNVGVRYHFSVVGCKLLGPSQLASTTAQAGTYVALSYHRFRAIVYPIRANLTVCKSILMICIIWSISFCLSLPYVLVLRLINGTDCEEVWPQGNTSSIIYTFSICFVQYVAPVALMAVFYIAIARALHDHRIAKELVHVLTQDDVHSHRHIVKMLVTIVTVYSVCMLPHHLIWIVKGFHNMSDTKYSIIENISYLFTYSNSVANPVIFFWYNKESRYRLKRSCLHFCCCVRDIGLPFEIRINKWYAASSLGNSKSDSPNPTEEKPISKTDPVKSNPFLEKHGDSDLGVSLPWEAQMLNSHTSSADECQEIRKCDPLPQDPTMSNCYPTTSRIETIVPSGNWPGERRHGEEPPEIASEEGKEGARGVDRVDEECDVTQRVQLLIKKMIDDITHEMSKDGLNNTDNGDNIFDNFSQLNDSSSTVELETGNDVGSITCLETGAETMSSSQDLVKDMITLLESSSPHGTERDRRVLREQLKNLPETRM